MGRADIFRAAANRFIILHFTGSDKYRLRKQETFYDIS